MSEHEQHQPDDADLVGRATAALRDTAVPDGPSERLLADTLSALRSADHGPRLATSNDTSTRRILTMRFVAKLAVAAVLAIVVGGLVWTAGPLGSQAAFADVLEKVQQVRSVRFKTVVSKPAGPGAAKGGVTTLIVGNRMRNEVGDGGFVHIMDSKTGEAIQLMPKVKRAIRMRVENAPKAVKAAREQNMLEGFRTMQAADGKSIGRKEIDGRSLDGYLVDKPGRKMTVWADPKTRLPVRIEATVEVPMMSKSMDVVMKDFEWDVPVDESAVSLAVPAGYTVEDLKIDASKATEKDLIEALRGVATANGGVFPGTFDMPGLMESMKHLMPKGGAGQPADKDALFTEMMQKMMPVTRGLAFVHEQNGTDFHYAGKGAKLGEAGRPIFWYEPAGSDKYRVIDADLTVKDVAADDRPKVESHTVKAIRGAAGLFGSPAATKPATGQ